jgi:hypothetical protein
MVPVLVVNASTKAVMIPCWTAVGELEPVAVVHHMRQAKDINFYKRDLPEHLENLVMEAQDLSGEERTQLQELLCTYQESFPIPGSPITGRADAVLHEIDTGSAKPIRNNPDTGKYPSGNEMAQVRAKKHYRPLFADHTSILEQ